MCAFENGFCPPENKSEITREMAEKKIEVLEEEILALEKFKSDSLKEIEKNTQEHSDMKKKELEGLDAVEFLSFEDGVELEFSKSGKSFKLEANGRGNNKIEVSIVDMIADMEWGIFYNLNHTTVSKDIYKKYNHLRYDYIEAYYDKIIRAKRDLQIIYQRLYIDNVGKYDAFLAQAYEATLNNENRDKQAGFVFEKIISSILQRIRLDLGDKFGLEFININVVDDIERKADCIIKIKKGKVHHRGVGVEEYWDNDQRKGIQLTLKKKGDPDFDMKENQVKTVKKKIREKGLSGEDTPIDDLVSLSVAMDNEEIMSKYQNWEKARRQIKDFPGGPDRFFQSSEIVGILEDIFKYSPLYYKDNPDFKTVLLDYFSKKNY